MPLGEVIQSLRKEAGISQVNLADASGLSRIYISEVERNLKYPSEKALSKIGDVFGIPPAVLRILAVDLESIPEDKREPFSYLAKGFESSLKALFPVKTNLSAKEDE